MLFIVGNRKRKKRGTLEIIDMNPPVIIFICPSMHCSQGQGQRPGQRSNGWCVMEMTDEEHLSLQLYSCLALWYMYESAMGGQIPYPIQYRR